MLLPSFLSVAALALTADAFLVPPEVSSDSIASSGVLDVATAFSTSKQIIELECQDCHAAVGKDGVVGYRVAKSNTGTKMSVEMKFAVQDGVLLLNGGPIYPPPRPGSPPVLYTAKQTVAGPSRDFYDGLLPLSVAVEMKKTEMIEGSDGALKMHLIEVEAIGLGIFPIHVPTVHVKLAELEDGEVRILQVVNHPSYALYWRCVQVKLLPLSTTAYKHNSAADACTTIVCRARTVLASKLAAFKAAAASAFRGCHRKLFGSAHEIKGKMHGHHAHHAHHHHHHHGGFRALAGRMMHHIFLPILLGIFTGAFVGAVAMVVFKIVRATVHRARGGHGGAYLPVDAEEVEEGRVSGDGLPKYEDVYVEPEEDVMDEKKEFLPERRAWGTVWCGMA